MNKTRIISFRLDLHHFQILKEQAGKKSHNTVARELLVRSLHEITLAAAVERRLTETNGLVTELRKDLSVTLQATLVLLGRATPGQAKDWADKHFKK